MNEKQTKLERVQIVSDQYEEALREADALRAHLASVAFEAKQHKATQQEIADRTKLSRQRIQQLLTERLLHHEHSHN